MAASVDIADITRVECRVNALTPGILVHSDAQTGLESKFSMECSAAVMLLTGNAGLAQFSDEQARDPRLRDLTHTVELVVDELPIDLATFATIVTVELASDESISRHRGAPHGYPRDPLSDAERHAKVVECCESTLGAPTTARLIELAESLEEQPSVAELVACLTPDSADDPR